MSRVSRPSAPRIDVRGVRNSWLTVEMNSFLRRSRAVRWLMSRKLSTDAEKRSLSGMGLKAYSTGKEVPSLRKMVSSPEVALGPPMAHSKAQSSLHCGLEEEEPCSSA